MKIQKIYQEILSDLETIDEQLKVKMVRKDYGNK